MVIFRQKRKVCYLVIRRFFIVILIVFGLLLAGCGGNKGVNELESLAKEAKLYLLEMESATKNDWKKEAEVHRKMAEFDKDESVKEKRLHFADLLEKKDIEGIKNFYKGLGGDLSKVSIKDKNAVDPETKKRDAKAVILALDTANTYFQATINLETEMRKKLADTIKRQKLLMIEENQKDIGQLAEQIEAGDKSGARIIYDKLYNRYIPVGKRSIFAKMQDAKSQEELERLIEEILK